MGHGHSHTSSGEFTLAKAPRIVLSTILAIALVATIVGVLWLWPHDVDKLKSLTKNTQFATAPGVVYLNADVVSVLDKCEHEYGEGTTGACVAVRILPDGGTYKGYEVTLDLVGPVAQSGVKVGDSLKIMETPASEDAPAALAYSGVNRQTLLWVMTALFALAVILVARWKGVFALVGLVFAGIVVLKFIIPALLLGSSGIAVSLVGGTAILFVVLYVAHGISWRTSAAFAGTLIGLLMTAGLGILAINLSRLHGMDENALWVSQIVPGLNYRELLACALVIAGIGVLNDVTITQASAVWELRAAGPDLSRMEVFAAGMRIGRDHIASTIYTIVFAYAGTALTLLLLIQFYDRPIGDLVTTEQFGAEIVRTLASAVGLVLSVPVTTGIAALTLGPSSLSETLKPRRSA